MVLAQNWFGASASERSPKMYSGKKCSSFMQMFRSHHKLHCRFPREYSACPIWCALLRHDVFFTGFGCRLIVIRFTLQSQRSSWLYPQTMSRSIITHPLIFKGWWIKPSTDIFSKSVKDLMNSGLTIRRSSNQWNKSVALLATVLEYFLQFVLRGMRVIYSIHQRPSRKLQRQKIYIEKLSRFALDKDI